MIWFRAKHEHDLEQIQPGQRGSQPAGDLQECQPRRHESKPQHGSWLPQFSRTGGFWLGTEPVQQWLARLIQSLAGFKFTGKARPGAQLSPAAEGAHSQLADRALFRSLGQFGLWRLVDSWALESADGRGLRPLSAAAAAV